ncbi:hypothetical protein TNCV_809141 [Trichonephila clavipes]|nr:hypothetical protein TNCV_809141 [Trichonephila clavipes]
MAPFSMNSAILSDSDNVTAFGVADAPRVEVRAHGEKYATRTLNILQLNINGTQRKIEELTEILNVNKVHIACLQETKLNPNLKLKIKGFTTLRKDRKDRADPQKYLSIGKSSKLLIINQHTKKADIPTNIISSSGRDAATNKETASLLAKHYENKSKLTFNANDRKLLRTYRKTIQDSKRYNHKNIFTIPFLMEELEAAIAKMNPGKALARMLFLAAWSNTLEILQKRTIEIFNLSWATGKLPKI